jgi:hypothetical protein
MNLWLSLSLLCTLLGSASSSCSICGPEMMVGNDEGVVRNRTCASLQEQADSGNVTDAQCLELAPIVDEPCECTAFICPICGKGGVMTDPGGIIVS